MKKFNFIRSKFQQGGLPIDPLLQSSLDWYRQWYEQRKKLPQFKFTAESRLGILDRSPNVVLKPFEELNKYDAVAMYQYVPRQRGDVTSRDIIYAADPASVPGFQEAYEKRKGIKLGERMSTDLGTNPNVMMHELSHWFDSREPQTMWKPREAKGEPEYQKYPKFYFNFKNSGLDKDQYKWIGSNQKTVGNSTLKTEFNAVLNELRQQEGLKGDQPTTPEQMDIIIQKYMNLPADKLQKTNPEGTRNQRIQTLIKYLQQDPAKLSEFNNTIVKGYNPQNSIFIGKDGGLPKYQKRPGTVRNNNLSEEEKAAIMKYLQSGKRPPVVTQNRPLTPQQQTRITQKAIQRQSKPPLTQISAQDQFYQNQRQKYGRTKEDIARTQQEAAIPYLLATGAIGVAAAAPLLATVAPAIGAGLSYAPIASAPAATLGNLLSSGFASDFLLNRAPQIPSQIGRGQYGDALANTAFGALDLMGVGAINPNVINNAGRLVNQGKQYLGNTYRNISEGNNIFNYAWRSPARGIDELQARNMYRQLKNQNTLDNATKDLIGEYQYSSGSFTGRFEPAINYARRIQLEDAIDAQRIAQQQNKPTVLVRTFKPTEKELYPINESGRVIMDRPTSWSVGLGAPHSVGDRMVIKLPSGSKGLLNEYNTTKYSQDLAPLSQERELILGSGLNIGKRLGKVKNEFGGYDYIHKFRGYDPTVYDDIRRLNTENIGEIVNLNRNLATSGGFNVGVYPFLKNPNIVLKLGTTGESGMANPNDNIFFTGIPKIARDIPTSMWAMNKFPAKEIDLSGLTAQQIGRNTSKPIPNNILGSIMERTNAGSLSNISFDELANIEPWVYRAAARNVNELIHKGIGVDFYGNNILFNSRNNIPEFNFIDLGPLPKNNAGVFPVGPLYALDSKALDQGVRMLDLEALKSIFKQKTRNALYDAAARSGIGSYSDQQIFDAIKKSEASIDEGLSLKKLLSLNNKQDGGPMVNPRGFMDGQPPIGSNWRIPGNTLYNPTPFKIRAVGSNGIEKTLKPFDTKRVSFGDAEYVDEYMLQKGGTAKKSRTHYIFAESPGYKPGSDLREAAKDNSFIKEALDMQSYLNKNYPDEKVVIIPGYESSDNPYTEKIKETLKESTPEDYIYLYGHHGSRYAGIPATEWGEYFKNAKYANCFLGSCSTDDLVTQQYKNVENLYVRDFDETQAPNYNTPFGRLHNFYYRPAEAWWGVNPNAPKGKDLLEGVLSAMYTTKNVNRDPVLERNLINLRNTRDKVLHKYIVAYSSDPEHIKLREEREKLWSESTKASDPKVSRKLRDKADLILKKLQSIEDKYAIKTGYSQLNNELDRNYNKLVTSPFISNKLIPGEHYRKHDYNMLFDFERIRPLVQRPPMLLGQAGSFKYGGSLSKHQIGGLPLPGGIGIGLMPKTKLVKEDVIVTTTTTRPSNTIYINDPRKVRLTTGLAIDPNRELMSGDYNKNIIVDIIKKSKKRNIDPYIGLAIGMQESGFGKTDSNIGHAVEGSRKVDPVNNYLDIYLQKQKDADRLGITDPYARIQLYNGYGKIFPSTEQKYHGFKMKKIYGVPVPASGLDLRKNPLYGKQIMDIVDNILKKNPEVVKLVENIKRNGGNALGMLRDYGGGMSVPSRYQDGREVTYTWDPSGSSSDQYMLKRTVTPYTSKRDIRRFTQAPTDPSQVNFISNYAGAIGDPSSEGFKYPTSVPFEGAKRWNIDRFIIEPAFSNVSEDLQNRQSTKREMKQNVLADMYKYFMVQNQGDKKDAWKQAKQFVRKKINPRIGGSFYDAYLRGNNMPLPGLGMGITDAIRPEYMYNVNRMMEEAGTELADYAARRYAENPVSKSKYKKFGMDWLMNYKGLSRKEAKDYLKESENEPVLNYKSGGQHGGLDRWFAEKWVDVKSGKPCGRQEGESRAYPACRPSKRVSSKTPKTSSELSSAEREKFKRSKTSSERIPYSHKRRK